MKGKMICFIFGHRYRLKRKITATIREVKCARCSSEFSMSDEMQTLLPMDSEFEHIHNELLKLENK